MNHHRIRCPHCEDGRLWTSYHGGNDPDVWDAGQCECCDGEGVLAIEDEHGLIEEGTIVTARMPGSHTWFSEPDVVKREWAYWQQFKAEANGMIAYGQDEESAVSNLIEMAEDEACERQHSIEEAWRCGA